MSYIRSYKDLNVWKKSIELAKLIYSITEKFPKNEMYGLTNQIRRSAVSVASNIAEGQARRYTREFEQFLYQSLGSLAELETQIEISFSLGFLNGGEKENVCIKIFEIQKMIHGILKSLDKKVVLN